MKRPLFISPNSRAAAAVRIWISAFACKGLYAASFALFIHVFLSRAQLFRFVFRPYTGNRSAASLLCLSSSLLKKEREGEKAARGNQPARESSRDQSIRAPTSATFTDVACRREREACDPNRRPGGGQESLRECISAYEARCDARTMRTCHP